MTQSIPRMRWFQLVILCGLISSAAFLRIHRLTADALWLDEYWALYLATGRGDVIFDMPRDQVIHSPPRVTMVNAPHIWHIWTGLDSTSHPPFYHLVLRGWVDCFGQSDFSIRFLSVLFSLADIFLLFDIVRRYQSSYTALIAAAFMTFAPIQTTYTQQARPYAMLVFLGLLLAEIILYIERNGAKPKILCGLFLILTTFALTHYFSCGVIVAGGVYGLIRLRGQSLRRFIATYAAAMVFTGIAWGPIFLAYNSHTMGMETLAVFPNKSILHSILNSPQRTVFGPIGPLIGVTILLSLIFGTVGSVEWVIYLPLALLVYIGPIFRWRRNRELLFWWLWAVFYVGVLTILDLSRHTVVLSVDKYIFLISPAAYAIFALPLPSRLGRLVPLALLTATIGYSVQQWNDPSPGWEHTRDGASLIASHVRPGELVILHGSKYDTHPAFEYFYIAHYNGEWQNPVVLTNGISSQDWNRLASTLAAYPNFWIFTDPRINTSDFPPAWHVKESYSLEGNQLLGISTP